MRPERSSSRSTAPTPLQGRWDRSGSTTRSTGFDQHGRLLDGLDHQTPGVITRDDAGAVDYVDDGGVYAHLTRPYATAIGGDVDSTTWDGAKLTIAFHDHPGVPAQHDVYWNRGTPSVTCDGAPLSGVSSDPTRLIFHVPCGVGATAGDGGAEHSLVFAPAP